MSTASIRSLPTGGISVTAPPYALHLAEREIPVFPCGANKRPCCENGFYDASTDLAGIAELWRKSPGPLIGVPMGEESGLDLLDIDPRHGGDDWLADLAADLGDTRTVQTRSGGIHFFYRHLPGVRNSQARIAPGVDVRGTGGYAIAWAGCGGFTVRRLPVAAWPDWLAALALPPPPPLAPPRTATLRPMNEGKMAEIAMQMIGRALHELENARPGERHTVLCAKSVTVGGLIEQLGISAADAEQKLYEAVQRAGAENLLGAYKTIQSGVAFGRAKPIEIGDRR